MAVTWIGLLASVVAFFNLWPRLYFVIASCVFLVFRFLAGDFSGYQSDGMLLEAGFISLFFAPPGLPARMGRGSPAFARQPVSTAMGVVPNLLRIRHGQAAQRRSAVAQLHCDGRVLPERPSSHLDRLVRRSIFRIRFTQFATGHSRAGTRARLMLFLPRRVRLICFLIVTPWEIGVILTANYTFLNYLVLSLGFLLARRSILAPLSAAQFVPSDSGHRPVIDRTRNDSSQSLTSIPHRRKPTSVRTSADAHWYLSAIRSRRHRGDAHMDRLCHFTQLVSMPLGHMLLPTARSSRSNHSASPTNTACLPS